nr:DUF485 domain-containing protein [Streptacidiphilus fuscans]
MGQEPAPPEEPPEASEQEQRPAGFDWWAATPEALGRQQARQAHDARAERAAWAQPVESAETLGSAEPAGADAPSRDQAAAVYRAVHESAEFQAIRSRYRRFVFPATLSFLLWYLLYVVLAVTAPQLMARPIAGPLNTAWLLGLLQFVSTFLLTWLYARHARDHRDRAALGLRWETQDRLR